MSQFALAFSFHWAHLYFSEIHRFHIDHNELCLPPKFCMTIVSNFSWVLQSSQQRSKIIRVMRLRKIKGVKEGACYYLFENGEITFDVFKCF